jgi:hypothetical protein
MFLMATANQQMGQVSLSDRMHVRRSRGALSGVLLILLGAWGALIPFVGPIFDYAYTPDDSWHYTTGRLWLEILPGAAAAVGGLILLMSAHRVLAVFGGWLAAAAGAWFVVGQVISTLWNDGVPAAGVPSSADTTGAAMEQIGFFSGLGVATLFLASLALGRMTVVGVKDLAHAAPEVGPDTSGGRTERYLAPSRTSTETRTEQTDVSAEHGDEVRTERVPTRTEDVDPGAADRRRTTP